MSEHFNQLAKHLDHLSRKHSQSTVFNDFLTLSICAYHTTNLKSGLKEKDPDNEALYFEALNKYDKEEIGTFPKMLAELHMHLDQNPYTDPLGDYFMLNISNGKNGQYFTPEPICTLMAKIEANEPVKNKIIGDPACGSGRTLLAFAQIHPQNFFVGDDIHPTCVKMSALNLFLHNLTAEINWMDTLSGDWFGGWHINTDDFGIKPIEKEQSYQWQTLQTMKSETKEPSPIILDFRTNTKKQQPPADQLNLFEL